MRVEQDVLGVLDRSAKVGNTVKLLEQLPREMYLRTNKVLEAAGGKWSRGRQAHMFEGDAEDRIEQIILTGSIVVPKDEFDYFPTPKQIAGDMVGIADIRPGDLMLEPSAGCGRIIKAMPVTNRITAVEINPDMAKDLNNYVENVVCKDFMQCSWELGSFDRIVMNPPFSKQQDIKHVKHALNFLKKGGNLVSIMSAGVLFRENRLAATFRERMQEHGARFIELPDDSFKESGTGVRAVMLVALNVR